MQRKYELSLVIQGELQEEWPNITEDDLPEADEAEERDGALYDSDRDYLEQNEVYQAHKGNGEDEQVQDAG